VVAATRGWNLGQSFFWTVRHDFNVLVETVWYETQAVAGKSRHGPSSCQNRDRPGRRAA
jgi:hypothetical protein